MADDRVVRPKVVLTPRAQDQTLRLDPRRFADQALLLAERKAAEALVEPRDLAAFGHLAGAAGPRGVYLRIDVEVDRVAFLAPGRPDLKLGAVGHLDVDHVVIGVDTGLHL